MSPPCVRTSSAKNFTKNSLAYGIASTHTCLRKNDTSSPSTPSPISPAAAKIVRSGRPVDASTFSRLNATTATLVLTATAPTSSGPCVLGVALRSPAPAPDTRKATRLSVVVSVDGVVSQSQVSPLSGRAIPEVVDDLSRSRDQPVLALARGSSVGFGPAAFCKYTHMCRLRSQLLAHGVLHSSLVSARAITTGTLRSQQRFAIGSPCHDLVNAITHSALASQSAPCAREWTLTIPQVRADLSHSHVSCNDWLVATASWSPTLPELPTGARAAPLFFTFAQLF